MSLRDKCSLNELTSCSLLVIIIILSWDTSAEIFHDSLCALIHDLPPWHTEQVPIERQALDRPDVTQQGRQCRNIVAGQIQDRQSFKGLGVNGRNLVPSHAQRPDLGESFWQPKWDFLNLVARQVEFIQTREVVLSNLFHRSSINSFQARHNIVGDVQRQQQREGKCEGEL